MLVACKHQNNIEQSCFEGTGPAGTLANSKRSGPPRLPLGYVFVSRCLAFTECDRPSRRDSVEVLPEECVSFIFFTDKSRVSADKGVSATISGQMNVAFLRYAKMIRRIRPIPMSVWLPPVALEIRDHRRYMTFMELSANGPGHRLGFIDGVSILVTHIKKKSFLFLSKRFYLGFRSFKGTKKSVLFRLVSVSTQFPYALLYLNYCYFIFLIYLKQHARYVRRISLWKNLK